MNAVPRSTQRPEALKNFLSSIHDAVRARAMDNPPAAAAADRMFGALAERTGALECGLQPTAPSVCGWLGDALAQACAGPPAAAAMAQSLEALAPLLHWQPSQRSGSDPGFATGHANTEIVGPRGIEQRGDVLVGASLMAPGVTYPDHDHPPEEIYAVISEGQWFRTETGWTTPGIGGIVHHPRGVLHAMRSGARPLLAVWCMWTGIQRGN